MGTAKTRQGMSLIELLVVLAIIGILFALMAAAVQRVRASAARLECANNLKQLGIGLHQYHDTYKTLPPGMSYQAGAAPYLYMSWHTRVLPFIEQPGLWDQAEKAYALIRDPFFYNPPHPLDAVLSLYGCPADGGPFVSATTHVAVTSYLGLQGTSQVRRNGVLFVDSNVRFAEVTDGLSNTLFVGERPPNADKGWGYWYAGWGADQDGTGDMVLGVRSRNIGLLESECPPGPYEFVPGTPNNLCDVLHFWSLHNGGANFLFGDGTVHFLSYSANPIMPALATRASGEVIPPWE
jgi:prepilin-type N-terminal cleavage/methylation domain-containing protein/prepilin-type processing-associated H-X9-DG protein